MRSQFNTFIVALLVLTSDVQSARVLGLFPHSGRSHQMVFEPLLQKLAEKGHQLTVVSFFPLENPPVNYTDVSLQGISQIGLETHDLRWYENPNRLLKMLGASLETSVKAILDFQPLADLALEICKELVDWEPLAAALKKDYDVVLVENFNSDCMLGLLHIYDIKAPIVALLSTMMMPWSSERLGLTDNPSFIPMCSVGFTAKMTLFERAQNTFLKFYVKNWFNSIQAKERAIIEKRFGRRIPDLRELARNTSLMITNTFHSLHGVRPLVPGVVEAGGMNLYRSRKEIPRFLEKFIDESEHGVVLFSFGSLIRTATIPKYREKMIVNVLSKLKQRVIWKYEDSEEEGTIEGNVMKVKWIPQYELLLHKKVLAFIAHGGLLGLTEAISAGKPMLVVPFFGDQPTNAANAERIGLAKKLRYEDLTEKSFSETLQVVLSPEMRLSARRASKIWNDKPLDPLDAAVYAVERVIRWGALDPLHSPARELHIYEYLLLDVAAVYILIVSLIILLFRYFIALLMKLLRICTKKDKKKLH